MDKVDAMILSALGSFLVLLIVLWAYGFHLNHECRLAGIEKGLQATDILAICK